MDAVPITATATDGPAAQQSLTTNERGRCDGLANTCRQRDFRAGRLAAKRAAWEILGARPKLRMEVRSETDARPVLTLLDAQGIERDAGIELSISHRDGRAVAAIAPAGLRVGVDLELVGSVPGRFARYFLTPAEQRCAPNDDMTVLWSLKEAVWKALGLGRSVAFKELELWWDSLGAFTGAHVLGVFVPMHAELTFPWPEYHVVTVWTVGAVA